MEEFIDSNEKHLDSFVVELTRDCNFKCRHCLRGDEEKKKVFDKKKFRKFLIENNIRSISTLTLTGGEPTLNLEAMRDIYELLTHYDISLNNIDITTNGTKLNYDFLDIIRKFINYTDEPYINHFRISDSPWHREERNRINVNEFKISQFTSFEGIYEILNDSLVDEFKDKYIDEIAERVREEDWYEYEDNEPDDEEYWESQEDFEEWIKEELEKNNYPGSSLWIRQDIIAENCSEVSHIYQAINTTNENSDRQGIFYLDTNEYHVLVEQGRSKNNDLNDYLVDNRRKRKEEPKEELEEFFIDNENIKDSYYFRDLLYFTYDGKIVSSSCDLDFKEMDERKVEPKDFFKNYIEKSIKLRNEDIKEEENLNEELSLN